MKRGIIFIMYLFLQPLVWSVEFDGGTGEPNDPYQIATAEQLITLGSDPNLLDKHFILVADIDVTAEETAGGLAGRVVWGTGTSVVDCYARGSVTGLVIGGLVGETRRTQFLNCFAACEMFPVEIEGEESLVGGLFGNVQVETWAPITVSCFWDSELSQIVFGASTRTEELEFGTGLTTEQMLSRRIFENAGWDFDTIWTICEGDYPTLQWETLECDDL